MAELVDYDQIRLTWGAVSNATSILIERSTSPTTGFVQIIQQPLPATSYLDVGLNEMTTYFPRIKNFNVSVKELNNKIIFLRKLQEGGSEHSFGIHVARMAGMPKQVVDRANDILKKLEKDHE